MEEGSGPSICEEVIEECEEEAEEDEGSAQDNFDDDLSVSDKDDLDSVDFMFDDWVSQVNDENLEAGMPDVAEVEEPNADLEVKVSVERIDVFTEGKTVQPLDKEAKDLLKRLREVFHSKAK